MLFFFPNRWSKRPSLNMPKLNLTLVWDNVGTSPKSNAHLSFHHENLLVNVLWIAKRSFDQNEKHQNQKILQNAYQSCRTSSQKMRHAHKPIRTLSVQNTIKTSRDKNYLSLLLFRRVTYYKGILFGRTSTPPHVTFNSANLVGLDRLAEACSSVHSVWSKFLFNPQELHG